MLATIQKFRQILTRREKMQVLVLLIAIIAMSVSQALGVVSVLPFISLVMDPEMVFENEYLFRAYEILGITSVNRFIVVVGIVMFFLIFFANTISAFATWLKLRFAWMNNHRLSRRLLAKYLSMPYPYFLNQNSSDLSKNILDEVNKLTSDYIIPLLTIITSSIMAIILLVMLFWVDPVISVFALFVLGSAYSLVFWRINRNLKQRGEKRVKSNKMRYKIVSEVFGGIKEIKVLNRESNFLARYSKVSLEQAILMAWNAVIGMVPKFVIEAIAFGGIIIFVLILLLTREDARQVIPLVSLFAFAGYRLMPAMQDIFKSFTKIQFNKAVLDRIYADFIHVEKDAPTELYTGREETEKLTFREEIKIENVGYNYPEAEYSVLENINLTIKHNTSVAFVGPTGAGKTTLVDLILGLLPPQKGRILVDDVPLDRSNIIKWLRNIGYVPQHIYLSDDTAARNIAFGVPDEAIDRQAVEQAAKTANIHDFIINELPDGYDTMVGERGVRLSGGQRQRIGIARALYHDPDLLVFDEATSALDGVTEEMVLQAIENAAKLKTLIIIAHRLTTVKKCDVVYILDRGKIFGYGTYDQLMESNEQFQKMAKVGLE